MLSALHELLQTGAYNSLSANFDIIRLLVSAYPDLDPMIVRATTYGECSDDFYFKYMSLLMHPDEGSDAAKRDSSLVKVNVLSSNVLHITLTPKSISILLLYLRRNGVH